MSPIIEFYRGEGKDTEQRYLRQILKQNFSWMEKCHDYIQWLFPLTEPSNFNPDAPLLTAEDIAEFHKDALISFNFDKAIVKWLSFLGISHKIKQYYFSEAGNEIRYDFSLNYDFEDRKYTWVEFNHNSYRITRTLKSMSMLGRKDLAKALLQFMKATVKHQDVQLESILFLEEAVSDEAPVFPPSVEVATEETGLHS